MLSTKMHAVMDEVCTLLAERDEVVEGIAVALLTGRNIFLLGDTGQAKSLAFNLFRERITGARQFVYLMSKQTDEEKLFGRLDLPALIRGETRLITTGKIPDSEIVYLDECFKAGDGILNSLLTAINEHTFTAEGESVPIPTISFFFSSNEIPDFSDPEDEILRPLYDRMDLKYKTEYIQERDSRLDVMAQKQAGRFGAVSATITLDELRAMQAEVAAVQIPDSVNELMDDVLCALREKGVHVSDRKYFGYYPLVQAVAWLDGRDTVAFQDLLFLRQYLWTAPADGDIIGPLLTQMCANPLKGQLDELLGMALTSYREFEADADEKDIVRLGKCQNELTHIYGEAMDLRGKFQAIGDTAQIDEFICALEEFNRKAHDAVGYDCTKVSAAYVILQGQKRGYQNAA